MAVETCSFQKSSEVMKKCVKLTRALKSVCLCLCVCACVRVCVKEKKAAVSRERQ